MDPELSLTLTRWTARIVVACYLSRVLLDVGWATRPGADCSLHAARWLWSGGCAMNLVHLVCALGCVHGWSQAAAYRHIAAQTLATTGLDWGGGLHVNYAFSLVWLGDTIAWWLKGPAWPYRSRGYFWLLHAVFAFMIFNATVVFGPPFWRWVALAVCFMMAALHAFAAARAAHFRSDAEAT